MINPSIRGVEKPNKCHCSCCLSNLVSHSVKVETVLLAVRETYIFIMRSFSLWTVKTDLPSAHHTPWTDWSYLWVQAAGCYTPSRWPGGSWWYTTQPRWQQYSCAPSWLYSWTTVGDRSHTNGPGRCSSALGLIQKQRWSAKNEIKLLTRYTKMFTI